MSDGLFRDMLMWKGFNDISWKMKLLFLLIYPVMVIVLLAVTGIKMIRWAVRFVGWVKKTVIKISGR